MKHFLYLILLVIPSIVSAQGINSLYDDKTIIDSLNHEIKIAKSDSLKGIFHFKISTIYLKDNNKKMFLKHLFYGKKLAKQNQFLNDVYYYYYAQKFILEQDRMAYQKALLVADKHLFKYDLPEVYSMRALIYRSQYINLVMMDKPEQGFKVLLEKSIPMARKAQDSELIGILYKSVAVTFYNDLKYDKAEFYISECIKYVEKKAIKSSTYQESLMESYLLYAEILMEQSKYDSINTLLVKVGNKLKEYPSSNMYPSYYYTKGLYEHKKGKYEEALKSYNLGISKALKSDDGFGIVRINFVKFNTLKQLKRYEEAKRLLITTINDKNTHIIDKKNYTKELAWVFKQLNDLPNALHYSERYIELSDSLNTDSYEKEIATLEAKYKSAENSKKINLLEIQKQKALLDSERNYRYLILLISSLAILIIILLFVWRDSKNKAKLAKQKEINYHQSLNALKSQRTLDVMQAMIDGEEKERTRLARDLHDGVGSRLSSLKMQMEQKIELLSNKTDFRPISDSLKLSITELRQVAFNLIPEVLLKLGLELALKDLCYSMSTNEVNIHFSSNEIDRSIKNNHQIAIFRIVQELINNALKHANCTEIVIDCSQNNNLFLITVEDNGKGFDYKVLEKLEGLGIKNIKNRVELLDGTFDIQSQIGIGTIFNIELRISIGEE
ncbi:tetratricopeptide repeat-containing sensor histidine kinase [Flavobacterium sp. TBRC 19031]|uniref:tetratricopeptide repeat-containing sensor histidine kinase n=1 Tax=Flavobacterium mekongense TaxID=3379707 RepID=UPI00399A0BAA